MKLLLSFLLTTPIVSSQLVTSNFMVQEILSEKIFVKDIISSEFVVLGEWSNADNDPNVPEWAKSSDEPYTNTYGKIIKNNSFYATNQPKIEFSINFEKLGGNYDNAKWIYNFNALSKVRLNFFTQAGQPAHNQNNGWAKSNESWTLLDLINNGTSSVINGESYLWAEWAGFRHEIIGLWNSDRSILKITWKANELRLKASNWSNGLFFRLELEGIDQEIPKL